MRSKFRWVILLFLTSLILTVLTVFQESFSIIVRPQISQSSSDGELPSDWPSVFFCNGTVCNEPFTGKVGDIITIALVAFNLTDNVIPDPENPINTYPLGNLNGFDVQLAWDPTVLKYVDHTVTVPVEEYPNPIPPSPYAGILHEEAFEIMNVIDENATIPYSEPGTMAWFSYAIMPGADVFNGDGAFFTMTFNVTKRGSSPLRLTNAALSGEGAMSMRVLFHKFDGLFRTPDAPTADFTFWPDIGVVDKPVLFNASASYSPVSGVSISKYIWDFDDGTNATVSDPIITHSYSESGTYMVSLVVEDSNGTRSSPKIEQVNVVKKRNVKIRDVSLTPAHLVLVNRTVDVEVIVENDGRADENCTVTAYYNASSVNWNDISTTNWTKTGETDVSIPWYSFSIEHLTWNTTGVPQVESYYYVLINATLVPYEKNTTDNTMISDPVFVTAPKVHDVVIEELQFGWSEAFKFPVLDGENTTFQITVLNEETENETAVNVTLYSNSSMLKTWTESLPYGETVELTWQELLDPGTYNITALATIENDAHPDNNRKEGILRVIRTPQLNVSYSPERVLLNQTVFLDASASFHREPGASITEYKWQIRDPTGTIVKTLSGPDLVNITYQFGEEGEWRVVLSVKDSYNIKYNRQRAKTVAYQVDQRIDVEEGSTNCFEVGTWNDVTYYVDITSNSTVNDFYFNPDDGPFIHFNVTGSSGTKGVCQVAIPKPLLWVEDGWQVYIDGQPLTNYTIIQDENSTYLYFTYTHSTKTVLIQGSHVIPEFSSTNIIPLFMVISLITLILAKRKHPKHQKP